MDATGPAQSRFATIDNDGSAYVTPAGSGRRSGQGPAIRRAVRPTRRGPLQIEGELVASASAGSAFVKGARVFHEKFGPGTVANVDGNKLAIDFDKAGRKMVLESFVRAA